MDVVNMWLLYANIMLFVLSGGLFMRAIRQDKAAKARLGDVLEYIRLRDAARARAGARRRR